MAKFSFRSPESVISFLKDRCGIDEPTIIMFKTSILVKDENDNAIVHVNSENFQDAVAAANRMLRDYYVDFALSQLIPDLVRDLKRTNQRKKMCRHTLRLLKQALRDVESWTEDRPALPDREAIPIPILTPKGR